MVARRKTRRRVHASRVVATKKTNGAAVIDARQLGTKGVVVYGLGAGDSELHLDVLDEPAAAVTTLQREVEWATMAHRGGVVPRLISVQADDATYRVPVYRHPADAQPETRPFHPIVRAAAAAARDALGVTFNHCLAQWYRGGADYISEHADKTLDVRRGSPVANLSLGATRVMTLRAKRSDGPRGEARVAQKIVLPHNSLFVLGSRTNREFTHAVARDGRRDQEKRPDERRDGGHRISLTFRDVATFHRDGHLEGQGAPDARCPSTTSSRATDLDAMLKAFSAENRQSDFDWDAHYGRGFATLGFDVLPPAALAPSHAPSLH
ncbi:hypothetical protein CTAYLR_003724 [Chrysophaeum taylorii]|uniref:Fe2OG dioxygenase domain-containing protein n=1 Tax=Chrysophaeum taylorii TaxID=2483200 RepID=A0AAD7XMR3_9STRA|nr:hypothetical protein CTAYLR_003724 [Chrysophaeum taylorii]